jgi:hypothetical protein
MKSRERFLISQHFQNLQPWLSGATCSLALLLGTGVHGQTTPPVPETPPTARPTVPAEIQPGHPAKGDATPSRQEKPAPSPQLAHPSPQPEGKEMGVIRPPPIGDTGIGKPPPSSNPTMRIVPPPGSPGGNQKIVPK